MAGVSVLFTPVARAARQFQGFGRSCLVQFTRPVSKGSSDGSSLPPKPKRPLTAYIRFATENLNAIHSENPGQSVTQRMAAAGKKWKLLSEEEKEKFKPTTTDMIRYNEELAAWETKLTDAQRAQIQQDKEKRKASLARFRLKKRMKGLGKPTQPAMSGFNYYVMSRPIERGDAPVTMYVQGLAQQWRKMAEEDKQPFEQEAKDARDKYQVELQKWEEKMISEGNFDMLRLRSLPKNIDKKTRKPKKMPKMKRVKKQAKPKKATKAKKKKAATKPKSKSKTSSSKKKKTEEEDHTWMRDE